ncbi:Primosomal protein N' [Pediococcus pentosaceus]|uniref:Primosomal protein N n=1 Tax=Pediococcus pentosaceus TaxID=1255 RepID=A0A1Y0VWL8_PEDPE|nr:Primosomal protein N' [Pediococcus pentosaceus]
MQLDQNLALNEEQQSAYNLITQAIEDKNAKPILVEGVTGSGKTEVYLQSIQQVIKKGKLLFYWFQKFP